MLPKQYRLPLRTQFARLKKEGRLIQGKLFSLLIVSSTAVERQDKPSRFAFIVSAKVHKKASKRNRAKRLLSEAVESLIPQAKPGFDLVFLAKKAIIEQPLIEIKKETLSALRQTGLLLW